LKAPIEQALTGGILTHPTSLVPAAGTSNGDFIQPCLVAILGDPMAREIAAGAVLSNPPTGAPSLYASLRSAQIVNDVDAFIRVASDFYRSDGIHTIDDVSPVAQAAYFLFERMGTAPRRAQMQRFLELHPLSELATYFKREFWPEVRRVSDTILALESLRLHGGEARLAHSLLLKALYGIRILHSLAGRRDDWNIAPIERLLNMRVLVPGWAWLPDPCQKTTTVSDMEDTSGSPLALQAKRVDAHRAILEHTPSAEPGGCDCDCDDSCVPQDPCCAHPTSLMTDLMVVRQTLHCYEPNEIAYIENAMAGERRTRTHETSLRVEQKQETETTATVSEERDHQVSEKVDLHSEIAKTVDQDLSMQAGVTANYSWGTGSVAATANASYAVSKSSSEQSARNYARDVVDRSVSKLERTVRELVSQRVVSKSSEVNEHVFDRVDKPHSVGIYHWVNKNSTAQVMGYGRRMVYQFVLPEPAEGYKALLARAFGMNETFALPAPTMPLAAGDITAATYLALVAAVGIENAPVPPDLTVTVTQPVGGDYGQPHHGFTGMRTQSVMISVPDGYEATTFSGEASESWNGGNTNLPSITAQIGGDALQWNKDPGNPNRTQSTLPDLTGQLQVVVQTYNVTSFNAQLSVVCTLKPEIFQAWQSTIHGLLMKDYQKQLDAYNASKAAFDADIASRRQSMEDSIRQRNPFFNRETERTALTQAGITMLSCQHFDEFNAMKRRVKPCGLPQMDLPDAEEEGKIIRFWQQALDWDLMTYLFYPYFWSPKCSWDEKIVIDTGDALFDKFMQAGAVRVEIPVMPGFEDDMLYWENTGQIWGQAGTPPMSDSDTHWISMVEEIKHQQDCYQTDREGTVDVTAASGDVTIKGSDRYWDAGSSTVDLDAVGMDLDREIVIDTVVYRITDISLAPGSPPFDPFHPGSMWWTVILDRPYEGAAAMSLHYAVGAAFVGAPWSVTVPTNLIWLKNDTDCLPCFPLPTCGGG
jgi:hypothetical protein